MGAGNRNYPSRVVIDKVGVWDSEIRVGVWRLSGFLVLAFGLGCAGREGWGEGKEGREGEQKPSFLKKNRNDGAVLLFFSFSDIIDIVLMLPRILSVGYKNAVSTI